MSRATGLDARDAKRWQAVAVLVLGACALAFTPIFMRLSGVDPVAAGFWRLGLAIPFLALLAAFARPRTDVLRAPPRLLWAAAVFFGLDLAFWHWGVRLTSVANATTLGNLSQVFVVIGAWLLFQERPRALFLAGLGLALGGVALMALAKDGAGGIDPLRGDVFSVVGAAWYGAYILAVRRLRHGLSATAVMLWTSLIGAPCCCLARSPWARRSSRRRLEDGPRASDWALCISSARGRSPGRSAVCLRPPHPWSSCCSR